MTLNTFLTPFNKERYCYLGILLLDDGGLDGAPEDHALEDLRAAKATANNLAYADIVHVEGCLLCHNGYASLDSEKIRPNAKKTHTTHTYSKIQRKRGAFVELKDSAGSQQIKIFNREKDDQ